jgi:SAM-dependent methyltransferase
MDANQRTAENRRQWGLKPSLRNVYHDLYRRMAAAQIPGRSLEVGSGAGNFKEFDPGVITTDLGSAPGVDLRTDAQALPFPADTFSNIFLFDVLHHIESPRRFLAEAQRVLRPGGRLIMVEPAITWASWPAYRLFHAEPVRLGDDPLADRPSDPQRDPFDGNMAIPTLLFGRYKDEFRATFPELYLRDLDWLSLWAYPLTGGFQPWNLLPAQLAGPLVHFENFVPRVLRRRLGFRLFAIVEKRARPKVPELA